jgi:hypothetical protein
MAGLDPAIHVFALARISEIARTLPAQHHAIKEYIQDCSRQTLPEGYLFLARADF